MFEIKNLSSTLLIQLKIINNPLDKNETIKSIGEQDKNFYIAINESNCTGCGLCIKTCPGKQGEKALDWKTEYRLGKNRPFLVPMEFTYAYAITCHKSQGSEWDKVLVIEEKFPFNKLEHARGLYTACTRAEEKLVLVLKE